MTSERGLVDQTEGGEGGDQTTQQPEQVTQFESTEAVVDFIKSLMQAENMDTGANPNFMLGSVEAAIEFIIGKTTDSQNKKAIEDSKLELLGLPTVDQILERLSDLAYSVENAKNLNVYSKMLEELGISQDTIFTGEAAESESNGSPRNPGGSPEMQISLRKVEEVLLMLEKNGIMINSQQIKKYKTGNGIEYYVLKIPERNRAVFISNEKETASYVLDTKKISIQTVFAMSRSEVRKQKLDGVGITGVTGRGWKGQILDDVFSTVGERERNIVNEELQYYGFVEYNGRWLGYPRIIADYISRESRIDLSKVNKRVLGLTEQLNKPNGQYYDLRQVLKIYNDKYSEVDKAPDQPDFFPVGQICSILNGENSELATGVNQEQQFISLDAIKNHAGGISEGLKQFLRGKPTSVYNLGDFEVQIEMRRKILEQGYTTKDYKIFEFLLSEENEGNVSVEYRVVPERWEERQKKEFLSGSIESKKVLTKSGGKILNVYPVVLIDEFREKRKQKPR